MERGLAPTRARAQALLIGGKVLVDGEPVTKAGTRIAIDCKIALKEPDHAYASRGALKLAPALDRFGVVPLGLVCLDVGASTGGFTDVLLERGAARVHAVDVGFGQLAWKLRQDARVVTHDKTNARNLTREILGEEVSIAVVDVSFISLDKILAPLTRTLAPGARVVALVKPQFEVGRGKVGKGGIVRDEADRRSALERILTHADSLGLARIGTMDSPVAGRDGNREFLAAWSFGEIDPRSKC